MITALPEQCVSEIEQPLPGVYPKPTGSVQITPADRLSLLGFRMEKKLYHGYADDSYCRILREPSA